MKEYNFKINMEDSFKLDKNNIFRRIYQENHTLSFTLNSLIKKNITGYCFLNKTKHLCDEVLYNPEYKYNWDIISLYYVFNSNNKNKFIICFSWEYFSPLFIYYPNLKKTIHLSYRYNKIDSMNFHIDAINKNKLLKSKVNFSEDNKIKYIFGIIPNIGHHFWNEIFGLLFIIDNNLIDNIDEIIIGKYDFLSFSKILENRFNKKISFSDNTLYNNKLIISTKKYINKNSVKLFKNIFDIEDYKYINNFELNILFDIRTNLRVCLNQIELCVKVIKNLINSYEKIKFNFYIAGWYTDCNNHNNSNIILQNNIFNKIQSLVDVKINNLIGYNLLELIKLSSKMNLLISNSGSGIGLFSAIINSNIHIHFTNNLQHDDFYNQNIALNIIESNNIYVQKQFITDSTESNFYIDVDQVIFLANSEINKLLVKNSSI